MNIPFHKAHGAKNDFLLTWAAGIASLTQAQLSQIAIAICDRNSGVGADGWEIVAPPANGNPPTLRLFTPDGGEVEISGNGTRCAAALLVAEAHADSEVTIDTGAGRKRLWLKARDGMRFEFEMDMGHARIEDADAAMSGYPAIILNVGNPQCALICERIPENWKQIGAELERHPRFPNRSNISFVRAIDRHTIEARFFERGAGATMSSGTGSTGAAVAAIHSGLAASPVTILTEAGPLRLRWDDSLYLTGPAELIARGEFYVSQ